MIKGMEIKLFQISEAFSNYSFKILPQDLKRLDKRYKFENIECEFRLKKEGDIISFIGHYRTVLKIRCDYCLSPISIELEQEFELDLIEEVSYAEPKGDVEIHLDSKNTETYHGPELDITQFFEDQIILDLPISAVCTETCQGLCNQCGINLNKSSCDCEKKSINNPFAVLSELDSDLKKD